MTKPPPVIINHRNDTDMKIEKTLNENESIGKVLYLIIFIKCY